MKAPKFKKGDLVKIEDCPYAYEVTSVHSEFKGFGNKIKTTGYFYGCKRVPEGYTATVKENQMSLLQIINKITITILRK